MHWWSDAYYSNLVRDIGIQIRDAPIAIFWADSNFWFFMEFDMLLPILFLFLF